jgi:hypothetical protein
VCDAFCLFDGDVLIREIRLSTSKVTCMLVGTISE